MRCVVFFTSVAAIVSEASSIDAVATVVSVRRFGRNQMGWPKMER